MSVFICSINWIHLIQIQMKSKYVDMFYILFSLFLFSYWCAYGPESTCKYRRNENTKNPKGSTKTKRGPCQRIKSGCRCHFIMHHLYVHLNDVIITYIECRHFDKFGHFCHGKSVLGRPQIFKYVPHISLDLQASVKRMVEDGFSVTMVRDKLISNVEHQYGKLFTQVGWDTLMTRMDILNIYNNIR